MVAGYVGYLGSLTRLTQNLLYDIVVALLPIPVLAQLPAINDISDQIELIGFIVLQEVEEKLCLAARRAEVDVRYPD